MFVVHPFEPLYDENSKILILGSFPSVKSREQKFFYGHKQNRFWKVISSVLECECPQTVEEKKNMLYSHGIALYDSIYSCEITGSSDSSIKNVTPSNLSPIFEKCDIKAVYCNGNTSYNCYMKYCYPQTGREAIALPSTSPANAAYSLEKLIAEYSVILLR